MAIFSKSEQGPLPPPERPAPPTTPASIPPGTLIAAKSRFVGELSGEDDLVVQGRFEGNIRVSRSVTIAGSGELEGDVQAKSVTIAGKVHGHVRADERAELLASASVQGNVHAPRVIIAEGAQLQGSVAMSAAPAPAAQPKIPSTQEQ